MNGYELSTPRAALGLSALAIAAITLGAMVVLPAKFESVSAYPSTLAAVAATNMSIEVDIRPAGVDKPEAVNREEQVRPDRTLPGAQEPHGKRHTLGWRGRSDT
jgi:hypothetical protein